MKDLLKNKMVDEIKKVEISKSEESHSNNYCSRCSEYYCSECVTFYVVEFEIEENMYSDIPNLKPYFKNFEGDDVCCWCYNQLVDLKNKK